MYTYAIWKGNVYRAVYSEKKCRMISKEKVFGFEKVEKYGETYYVKEVNPTKAEKFGRVFFRLFIVEKGKRYSHELEFKEDKLLLIYASNDLEHKDDLLYNRGFKVDETRWDKYSLHWNFYKVDFDELKNEFGEENLLIIKEEYDYKESYENKDEIRYEELLECREINKMIE